MFNHRNRIGAGYEKSRLIKDFFFPKKKLAVYSVKFETTQFITKRDEFFSN